MDEKWMQGLELLAAAAVKSEETQSRAITALDLAVKAIKHLQVRVQVLEIKAGISTDVE